ncbi:MAG TPA: hypothetical protein VHL57_05900 [Flavobacteriales bacterium]|nr:hypothetical protein [Flavobacteriales bacterium]
MTLRQFEREDLRFGDSDAPEWFRPDSSMLIWNVPDRGEATLFFQDPQSEHVFLYERQL